MPKGKYVVWFKEVGKEDVGLVGGKGANLGEMTQAGFPVPPGFIITSKAYFDFIEENKLDLKIKHLLGTVHFDKQDSLSQVSSHIKKQILSSPLSETLNSEILSSYKLLGGVLNNALVAVRSSATAEDLPGASFAGQQETFLNVSGEANVLQKVKEGWASLFDARAIFYRNEKHFDHFKVGIALPVQKMVESEKSGVMFTIDPLTNDKNKIVIEAIYGLGELIVQGSITPDHYEVDKKTLRIELKKPAKQTEMLKKVGIEDKIVKISKLSQEKQKISDKHILELAKYGEKLEHHYFFPQDIEWAIEGNKVYIVQTRPITTIKKREEKVTTRSQSEMLLKGDGASPGIASGPVRIVHSPKEIGKVGIGEILVAPQTSPDFVPAMKRAAAIVTDSGGRTSHAAIVSRELGIPAVVGTGDATKKLKDGLVVTVDGLKGEVYRGAATSSPSREIEVEGESIKTATKVYVNLAEPEIAGITAAKNVDGVGLLRAEFMMAGIGTHPKKLIHDGKKQVFIEKLAEGLEEFCKSFSPRPVVYRASDLKTNEYRQLAGGSDYEPVEPNPMLGFRGAYRYIHDPEVFKLELEAIKIVRNKQGYKNLWLMVPFVRTVKELEEVKKLISIANLHRSPTFKLWMMVEIPSNVILLDKLIEVGIDGISVGTNDLTMLLLGTDRDNNEVAPEFDERNEAVSWALEHIIKTAHKHNITSSICGQSVSTYHEILERVVRLGVTSVSVSPDAIGSVRKQISEIEASIINRT